MTELDGHQDPAPRAELIVPPRRSPVPMIVAAGIALLAAATFIGLIYAIVGAILLVGGLTRWLRELSHDVSSLPREQRQTTAPLPARARRRPAS